MTTTKKAIRKSPPAKKVGDSVAETTPLTQEQVEEIVGKGGLRPVTVGDPVDVLPTPSTAPVADATVEKIIAAGGKFVPVDAGGRKVASARNSLEAALKKRGYKSKSSVVDGQLFISAEATGVTPF